jgi:hypothetical protein
MRHINGLAWCAQAVMEAAEELREASSGTATSESTAAETGFEHARVAAHLEAAAAALDSATVAAAVCAQTANRLRELAAEVRAEDSTKERARTHAGKSAAPMNLESLERTLTVCEEKLFAALTSAAPEELLVGLKEHAARELAPYRSRMGVVQLRQVEHQFVQKQLLAHYNLPRLSLFYMSQQ